MYPSSFTRLSRCRDDGEHPFKARYSRWMEKKHRMHSTVKPKGTSSWALRRFSRSNTYFTGSRSLRSRERHLLQWERLVHLPRIRTRASLFRHHLVGQCPGFGCFFEVRGICLSCGEKPHSVARRLQILAGIFLAAVVVSPPLCKSHRKGVCRIFETHHLSASVQTPRRHRASQGRVPARARLIRVLPISVRVSALQALKTAAVVAFLPVMIRQ